LLFDAVQLHDLLATKDSAEVAHENENRLPALDQLSELETPTLRVMHLQPAQPFD
jgi:hypothetical protein